MQPDSLRSHEGRNSELGGQTLAEKILSRAAGCRVVPGEIVIVDVDLMMTHDGNRPLASDVFRQLGGTKVPYPQRVKFVMDHVPGTHNSSAAEVHKEMRVFTEEQGVELIVEGMGIAHQVIPERGYITPGDVLIGSDSHSTTYGAFQVFGTGVGSSDLAVGMMTGKAWMRVPESIQVRLQGLLPDGVYAKDIALDLLRVLTADGATYQALEFTGDGVASIDIGGRMTLANLAMEMGAKAGLFPYDEVLDAWVTARSPSRPPRVFHADPDARYSRILDLDLSQVTPSIAAPHQPDNVFTAREYEGTRIDHAFIGTCVNGRYEDLKVAAQLLDGRQIAPGVRMLVTPASQEVLLRCLDNGIIATLVRAGVRIGIPGCTGCTGASGGEVPASGDRVISAGNRNFRGRLGNRDAEIYLASPATVAASAVTGYITDPRPFLEALQRS